MTKDTFELAEHYLSQIKYLENELQKIKNMEKRDDDDEFNKCRTLAYDSLNNIKKRYEEKFEDL